MSDTPDVPPQNPFPDMSRAFSGAAPSGGPVNWEVARQVATAVASGGTTEPAPAPHDVAAFEAIVRAAEMALDRVGVLPRGTDLLRVRVASRSAWAVEAIDSLKGLMERLATRLGVGAHGLGDNLMASGEAGSAILPGGSEGVAAAMQQAMEALFKPLAPILSGMQMGLVMGFVATRALGQYDLCLPRAETGVVSVIPRNADEVAAEIAVGRDEMRMWVAMHEIAHASAFAIPWVRRRLQSLLEAYLDSIHVDTSELQEHLRRIDPQDPASLQRFAESAEGLLGRFITSDQPDVLESVQTFMSVLEGYADHVVGVAGTGLLRDGGRIAAGLRQRAETAGEADRLLDSLLGLELTQGRIDEATRFCGAVTARAGIGTLNRMWESIETLPTREELARPDAWLSRMATTPEGGIFRELG